MFPQDEGNEQLSQTPEAQGFFCALKIVLFCLICFLMHINAAIVLFLIVFEDGGTFFYDKLYE
jgi:hypothetical protein